MPLRSLSISTYMVFLLLLVTTVLLGLFSVGAYSLVRDYQMARLRNDLSVKTEQLASGLSVPAWNFDATNIETILDGMMRVESVTGLEVETGTRSYLRTRDAEWNVVREGPPAPSDGLILRGERPILYSGLKIGTVRVAMTTRFVDRELAENSLILFGIMFLLDVGLILILYLVLDRKVLGPLMKIERFAGRVMSSTEDRKRQELSGEPFQGELETLRKSIVGMVDDLDARYRELSRSRNLLRDSEARFRSIFDNASDGILIARLSSKKFVAANQAICDMLGYAREEVLRLGVEDIHPPQDLPRVYEDFDRQSRSEIRVAENLPVMRKDGTVLFADVSANSVEFDGEWYQVGFFRDITDRRRSEEERGRLRDQLQQAMKMEAVGRLAGGVAHDFNNLLTVILGNVELAIRKLSPSDPLVGMLSNVQQSAERTARLTQQLLAFSRRQILEPRILDVNRLIAEMHPMLVRLIGEHIEMRTVPGEGVGSVKIDQGQFEQILVNLAVNARDAMPSGGSLVIETSNAELDETDCRTRPDARPGRFVLLSVNDTGHGMSDEVKAHLFEPFFTTKPMGRGTGLGLATTYGSVRQAGGSIEVHSELGEGTTVRIFLPRAEEAPAMTVSEERLEQMPGGSETILLVEDEEMLRSLGLQILEGLGYKVICAGDGGEAMALVGKHGGRIDLLLTDVVMPGMNGRELAERLKPLHPETRVLFTSGYTDDLIVQHGVLDGGVDFIGKPYTPRDLARKIREVLDRA